MAKETPPVSKTTIVRADEVARAKADAATKLAENVRTDERVDGFAQGHIKSLTRSLRIAAVMVFFLVAVIVVLAGKSMGFTLNATGITFDGGGEPTETPAPAPE